MHFSVTKNGEALDPKLYTWDEDTKTFLTKEDNLVLDFSGVNGVVFKTGSDCTFKTGFGCTFKTGSDCMFDTESYCTFDTESDCTFKTGLYCVVVRRDVFEVIEIPENVKIKLDNYKVKGYTIIEEGKVATIKIGEFKYAKKDIEEKLKDLKPVLKN